MQKMAVPGRDAQSSVSNIMLCVPHLNQNFVLYQARCIVSNGLSCVDQLETILTKNKMRKKVFSIQKKMVCASSRYHFPQSLIMIYKKTPREFVLGGKKMIKKTHCVVSKFLFCSDSAPACSHHFCWGVQEIFPLF